MPPKRSDLNHVTFHFYRSAVLLSVPASTTLAALKAQLLPALQPFKDVLPVAVPNQVSDIRVYEEKSSGEGITKLGAVEEESKSIQSLGWGRWKTVFVSFRGDNGFDDPVFTLPQMEDDD